MLFSLIKYGKYLMTVYLTVLFYILLHLTILTSLKLRQIPNRDEWWTGLIKRFYLHQHVLLNVLFAPFFSAAPFPSWAGAAAIICHVSKKKKKKRIWAAPHGWAPRITIVWMKPESGQADKMWNSWRRQEGKFQTNSCTCGSWGLRHFHVAQS